ncbi:MAG: YdeI/OmpD-associated family protein [Saprospiraceae bacterium]|nr:YdeI/OmpD-associated family protein [Saprospiraceae bacterium]MBL0081184.1 YdeI/OmpD-associated family protein [Saprospiraceae bacterium]
MEKPSPKTNKITFKSSLLLMDSTLWGAYIPVPSEIALMFKQKSISRFICEINHVLTTHSAIMPGGNDTYFILMNKANCKVLKLPFGAELVVDMVEDTSEYGMPLCEELQVLLDEDPDFLSQFRKLTPGKQRNLIYIINKPKSSELRLRTAIAVAGHLAANKGKLDFKMLNEALKSK